MRPPILVMRRWPIANDPKVAGGRLTMADAAAWGWICHTGGCATKPETGYAWTDTAALRDACEHLRTHTALDRTRAVLARTQHRLDEANARTAAEAARRRLAEDAVAHWREVADARTCTRPHDLTEA